MVDALAFQTELVLNEWSVCRKHERRLFMYKLSSKNLSPDTLISAYLIDY